MASLEVAVIEDGPRRSKKGRPRAVEGPGGDDPRGDILNAAASLFTTVGYTRTTTRQIAEAVGLRQGSLFHYFDRKKDILDELLRLTINPAMATAQWLAGLDAAPEVKFYLLAKRDATNLCSLPHNLGLLYFQPEISGEEFAAHWESRERLRAMYRSLLEEGLEMGTLASSDVELATDAVFGLVESTCTWFAPAKGHTPARVGESIGRFALQMVMPAGAAIDPICREAARFDGSHDPHIAARPLMQRPS